MLSLLQGLDDSALGALENEEDVVGLGGGIWTGLPPALMP